MQHVEPAAERNRPPAPSDDALTQWDQSGIRHRLMRGTWRDDGERRLQEFFSRETWEFLPGVVLAFNPLKTFATQTATLYDGSVSVHPAIREGEPKPPPLPPLTRLDLDLLWPQQQETLEFVRAMNDALVLRSWDRVRGCVRYQSVAPDCVVLEADPDDPTQPNKVVHYRRRRVPGYDCQLWCRDTYDFSMREPPNEAGERGRIVPYLRIEAWVQPLPNERGEQTDGDWVDVTLAIMPDLAPTPPGDSEPRRGMWPYWTDTTPDAEPIWCWTAYHARVGSRLLDTWSGAELVDLTLISAVLWTYWLGGFRDAAFAQRWMLDADLASAPKANTSMVAANVMMVMALRSTSSTGGGQAGQWSTAFDVEASAAAIGGFMAAGALFVGLSSADVSIGSAGLSRTSASAIEVSREGVRKVERRMAKPMGIGDAHNIAGAAQLANAYAGTDLPVLPSDYRVVYSETARTVAEVQSEVDGVTRLVGAKLMHPGDAIHRMEPHLTADEAKVKAVEIAEFAAMLEGVAEGAPLVSSTDMAVAVAAVEELRRRLPEIESMGGTALPSWVAEKLDALHERLMSTPTSQADEADPADLSTGTAPTDAAAPLASTALNGAQVTAALGIVQAVATGQLPRASGVTMLVEFFQLAPEAAERAMGEVGRGFQPAPPTETKPPPAAV